MRITQAYISASVGSFADLFRSKYELEKYTDRRKPTVMFGMYKKEDFTAYLAHQSDIIVVWCGSDSMWLNTHNAAILKSKPNTVHYAMGKFLSDDLKKFNIPHTIKPINPSNHNLNTVPRGHKCYSYGIKDWGFYGLHRVQRVCDALHMEYTLASYDTFCRDEILKVYTDSFLGLRLTTHDGLPNTVIELGLMGRMCIYNGDLPNCIPWTGDADIRENMLKEYVNRHEPNKHIGDAMKEYLNISDNWLNI
jgi:hypothetical protein